MKTIKVLILGFCLGIGSMCLADSSEEDMYTRMGIRGSYCGLVRALYYQRGEEQVQTAEVTLQSSEDSIRIIDANVSEAVLIELGEDEQQIEQPFFTRRLTALSDMLYLRYIQVCLEDVLVVDEYDEGVVLRSGYIEVEDEDAVRIIEL